MMKFEWRLDPATAYWAGRIAPARELPLAAQWPGGRLWAETWQPLIGDLSFPEFCNHSDEGYLDSKPANIVACLREGRLLEGLALTVGWGGMARTRTRVYEKGLDEVRRGLEESRQYLAAGGDVQAAWEGLGQRLGWTSVMRSKFLHFLARSLGYELNPPVALDGAVMLDRLWPWFRGSTAMMASPEAHTLPGVWVDEQDSWAGFKRYMTAMVLWSEARNVTTTAMENSLFHALSSW